jgi:hypothetical protein
VVLRRRKESKKKLQVAASDVVVCVGWMREREGRGKGERNK